MPSSRPRVRLALSLGLLLASAVRAQTPLYELGGQASGDMFGFAMARLGDLDGDARDDYAIGSYTEPAGGSFFGDGAARAYSGFDGHELFSWHGPSNTDHFGEALAGELDWNRDGVPDIVVGAHLELANGSASGAARVYSGANGGLIAQYFGNSTGDLLGDALAVVGDLDGDGCAELAIGVPGEDANGFNSGQVRIYKGGSGQLHLVVNGPALLSMEGRSLAGVGDVDLDGVPDWASSAPNGQATVKLFSGANGALMHTWQQTPLQDWSEVYLLAAGDLDGDGVDDLVLGAPNDASSAPQSGAVRTVSGATKATLASISGQPYAAYGRVLANAGDFDDDGIADLLLGTPLAGVGSGGIAYGGAHLRSGADLAPLWSFPGHGETDGGGAALLGDVNGDGELDFAIAQPGGDSTVAPGIVRVISGRTLALVGSPVSISTSLGGAQQLSIDAGLDLALRPYLVLGSLSGSAPGVLLDGWLLPLVPDAYTQALLSMPNQGAFVHTLGWLDAEGRASAQIALPAGFAGALAGQTAQHACLAIGANGAIALASNASPLKLLP